MDWFKRFLCAISGGRLPFCKPKPPPEPNRHYLMMVRPKYAGNPSWWPGGSEISIWCSMDPDAPGGWSQGESEDFVFSTDEIWEAFELTRDEFVEALESEWREERPEEPDATPPLVWEFRLEEYE